MKSYIKGDDKLKSKQSHFNKEDSKIEKDKTSDSTDPNDKRTEENVSQTEDLEKQIEEQGNEVEVETEVPKEKPRQEIVKTGVVQEVIMLSRQDDAGARFAEFKTGVVIVAYPKRSFQTIFRNRIDFEQEFSRIGTIVEDEAVDSTTVLMVSTMVEPVIL